MPAVLQWQVNRHAVLKGSQSVSEGPRLFQFLTCTFTAKTQGYGRASGTLVDAVRRRPHCVLVLEDIDRAHPEVSRERMHLLTYLNEARSV